MANLDSILESQDSTLLTKIRIVKAMVFPAVKYHCESWTIKTAECQRTDVFELWCQRRLLRLPLAARRANQSILKEIIPEFSLKGLMLKLKLQYFGHLTWRTDSLVKSLMLGKIEGGRRRGQQRVKWLESITDSMAMNLGKLQELVRDREAWHAIAHGTAKSQTWLSDWTKSKLVEAGMYTMCLWEQGPYQSSQHIDRDFFPFHSYMESIHTIYNMHYILCILYLVYTFYITHYIKSILYTLYIDKIF